MPGTSEHSASKKSMPSASTGASIKNWSLRQALVAGIHISAQPGEHCSGNTLFSMHRMPPQHSTSRPSRAAGNWHSPSKNDGCAAVPVSATTVAAIAADRTPAPAVGHLRRTGGRAAILPAPAPRLES